MSKHKNNSAKYFTRGGQIMFHNLRMLFQINKAVGKIYFLSLLVITAAVGWVITPKEVYMNAFYLLYSKNMWWLKYAGLKDKHFWTPYHGRLYEESASLFLTVPQLIAKANEIYFYAGISLFIALVISISIG